MDDAIPRKRGKDLVVRPHGDETLVLDRRTGTAHCLPAEITRVWDACTGRTTLDEIASVAMVDQRIAVNAVDQLVLLDLLESGTGFDRRKFLQRSAAVGAGVAAVPVIESVIAPSAAWAASPTRTITVEPFCTGSTANGRLKNIYVTLTSWPTSPNQYQVQTIIGPVPPDCTPAGVANQTYTSSLTNLSVNTNTGNSNRTDIHPSNIPVGSTPQCTTTPVTVNVYQGGVLQKSVTVPGGPCPCTSCPQPVGASPSPTDTGSPSPTDTGSPSPTNTASPSPTDTGSSVPSPAGRPQLRVHPLRRHTTPPPRTAPAQPSGSPTVPGNSPSARDTSRRR